MDVQEPTQEEQVEPLVNTTPEEETRPTRPITRNMILNPKRYMEEILEDHRENEEFEGYFETLRRGMDLGDVTFKEFMDRLVDHFVPKYVALFQETEDAEAKQAGETPHELVATEDLKS